MKREDYTVGWICALPTEMAAAEGMLDDIHEILSRPAHDDNAYTFGRIGKYNVVVACLPAGFTGVTSAAVVAEKILHTFPSLKIGLMVGIGGGVPSEENDIRLGDVVVSKPDNTEGGVIQYDFGKVVQYGKFQRTGVLNRPPDVLLGAIARLQARHLREDHHIQTYLAEMTGKFPRMQSKYAYPGKEKDLLFEATYEHELTQKNCAKCDTKWLVSRDLRSPDGPEIFYGLIASANQVIKHGATRDRLGKELGVLCFEMEAAGLMNRFPCLIIRGISDYADSHKNDKWQQYAAATAAGYAKELLTSMPPEEVANERPISEVLETDSSKQYRLGLHLPENSPLIDDESFIGRQKELEKLKESLAPQDHSKSQRIVIVSGLGGVGKTQLTMSFIKRNRELFSAIFWLDARNESILRQSFTGMASDVFHTEFKGTESEEDVISKVKDWLSKQENNKWLLVFDNYDNPQLPQSAGQADPDAYNIRSYFPKISQGAILITTRSPNLTWGKDFQLASLGNEDERLEILANRSQRPEAKHDADARKLTLRLGGLPLALVTAGAYLKHAPDSFNDYLQMYEDNWKELESTAAQLDEYAGRTLYSTWNISYARIQAQDADVASLLQFMAYLDNQDIWFELLSQGKNLGVPWLDNLVSSKIRFTQAMNKLQDYSLVEMHPQTGGWSLHNCVHDWTLEHLNSKVNVKLCQLAVGCIRGLVAPSTKQMYWQINRRLLPHADRLKHKRLTVWTEKSTNIRLLHNVSEFGTVYYSLGRLGEAEKIYKRVLEGYEKAFGAEHPSTLKVVNNLAIVYNDQGKLDEAEKMCEWALEGYEKAFGVEHPSTLNIVNNLAIVYNDQGKLGEAEKMCERALEGYEKAFGVEHPSTLEIVNNLALVYSEQGKRDEAEKMCEWALEGYEKAFGAEHLSTLNVVNNLAVVYRHQGKLGEAEKMYERALEGYEQALMTEGKGSLNTMYNLALLYEESARPILAATYFRTAAEGYAKILGSDHPETIKAWNWVSRLSTDSTTS